MTGTTSTRKLATVRIISRVDRIPNADRIALARVGGSCYHWCHAGRRSSSYMAIAIGC